MGTIQNSVNQVLGTVAGATAMKKHLQNQENQTKSNEISILFLSLLNISWMIFLKQGISQYSPIGRRKSIFSGWTLISENIVLIVFVKDFIISCISSSI